MLLGDFSRIPYVGSVPHVWAAVVIIRGGAEWLRLVGSGLSLNTHSRAGLQPRKCEDGEMST